MSALLPVAILSSLMTLAAPAQTAREIQITAVTVTPNQPVNGQTTLDIYGFNFGTAVGAVTLATNPPASTPTRWIAQHITVAFASPPAGTYQLVVRRPATAELPASSDTFNVAFKGR